jgi:hypothetical protein
MKAHTISLSGMDDTDSGRKKDKKRGRERQRWEDSSKYNTIDT